VGTSLDQLQQFGSSLLSIVSGCVSVSHTAVRLLLLHWQFSLLGLVWLLLLVLLLRLHFGGHAPSPVGYWHLRRHYEQAHRRAARRHYNPGGFARHGIHRHLPWKLHCYHPVAILHYWQCLRRRLCLQQVLLKCYDYFLNLLGHRCMAPNDSPKSTSRCSQVGRGAVCA
jgi:hypothetical protein